MGTKQRPLHYRHGISAGPKGLRSRVPLPQNLDWFTWHEDFDTSINIEEWQVLNTGVYTLSLGTSVPTTTVKGRTALRFLNAAADNDFVWMRRTQTTGNANFPVNMLNPFYWGVQFQTPIATINTSGVADADIQLKMDSADASGAFELSAGLGVGLDITDGQLPWALTCGHISAGAAPVVYFTPPLTGTNQDWKVECYYDPRDRMIHWAVNDVAVGSAVVPTTFVSQLLAPTMGIRNGSAAARQMNVDWMSFAAPRAL